MVNNFNSIKVRLELYEVGGLITFVRFQFHKGTIRTLTAAASAVFFFSNFNSIKVRLELGRTFHLSDVQESISIP